MEKLVDILSFVIGLAIIIEFGIGYHKFKKTGLIQHGIDSVISIVLLSLLWN